MGDVGYVFSGSEVDARRAGAFFDALTVPAREHVNHAATVNGAELHPADLWTLRRLREEGRASCHLPALASIPEVETR